MRLVQVKHLRLVAQGRKEVQIRCEGLETAAATDTTFPLPAAVCAWPRGSVCCGRGACDSGRRWMACSAGLW